MIKRLFDEAAIRDMTARFADAAIRGDHDLFRALWADDAEWTIGHPPKQQAHGIDNIVEMLGKLRDERDFFVQLAIQGPIKFEGDTATTTCVCHEAARGPGEAYYQTYCISFDRLRRSGDGWLFTQRSYQFLWLDTSPFTGDAFGLPAHLTGV